MENATTSAMATTSSPGNPSVQYYRTMKLMVRSLKQEALHWSIDEPSCSVGMMFFSKRHKFLGVVTDSRALSLDDRQQIFHHSDTQMKHYTIGPYIFVTAGTSVVSYEVISRVIQDACLFHVSNIDEMLTLLLYHSLQVKKEGVCGLHCSNQYLLASVELDGNGEFLSEQIIEVTPSFKTRLTTFACIGSGGPVASAYCHLQLNWKEKNKEKIASLFVNACAQSISNDIYCGGPLETVFVSRVMGQHKMQISVDHQLFKAEDHLNLRGIPWTERSPGCLSELAYEDTDQLLTHRMQYNPRTAVEEWLPFNQGSPFREHFIGTVFDPPLEF